MIKWEETSNADVYLIRGVVDRVMARCPDLNRMDAEMDIAAANLTCPMDLYKLIEADDFNFWHDVSGIGQHLNRETGELENCFHPRCAKPSEA